MAKVFAIDTGFGSVKWARRENKEVIKGSFLSIVIPFETAAENKIGTDLNKLNHIKTSKGVMLCGKNIHNYTMQSGDGKTLSEDYPMTVEYEALVKGALLEGKVNNVETLVLGLPVSLLKYAPKLKEKFTGLMQIGNSSHKIDNVMVLPQPVGSYIQFEHTHSQLFKEIHEMSACVLFVDVGFGTTDWITVAGENILPRRAGGMHIAVGEMLKFVAQRIRRDYGGDVINDLEYIDEKIRNGRNMYHAANVIQHNKLKEYLADFSFVSVVESINQSIITTNDIKTIVLTGGGADYIEEALDKQFPSIQRVKLENNVFANVLGFLYAGERNG